MMQIAILMTNTDVSPFSDRHPKDGDKFSDLIRPQRPDWAFTVFDVKADEFPGDVTKFDGVIITGSPASVHDGAPWIARLEQMIRDLNAARIPVFGACFGHQAIATALGGAVSYNPNGWVMGTVTTAEDGAPIRLYAAHKEQVTELPDGATVRWRTQDCPIAGFALGTHILTTQYHPEMTDEFIAALVDELEQELPASVIAKARDSLTEPAERDRIAARIVAFFEAGQSA